MPEFKSGLYANSAGSTLEKTIMSVLEGKGFTVVTFRDYNKNPDKYGKELLLKNVPYNTI